MPARLLNVKCLTNGGDIPLSRTARSWQASTHQATRMAAILQGYRPLYPETHVLLEGTTDATIEALRPGRDALEYAT